VDGEHSVNWKQRLAAACGLGIVGVGLMALLLLSGYAGAALFELVRWLAER
jgi:hypothetical protein